MGLAAVLGTLLTACVLGGAAAADAAAQVSDLTQMSGPAGCTSGTGVGRCTGARALTGATSVTVSPDGRSAYVVSDDTAGDLPVRSAIAVFDRARDGVLSQKPGAAGCVSNLGDARCSRATALVAAGSLAVSPDGRSAYVASAISDAVAVFDRAADGRLTQKPGIAGCISNDGAGRCADGSGLNHAQSVTVSRDGRNIYVASYIGDAVAVFDRAADGRLTQKPGRAGCVSATGFGPCADGRALDGASAVAMSRDGTSVYVASARSEAVAVFDRAADGRLTQKPGRAGCVSATGFGPCAAGRALAGASSVTVSASGASAYVASPGSAGLAAFDRARDGTLTQKPGPAGCVSSAEATSCAAATALRGVQAVTLSPDGRSAYAASFGASSVTAFDRGADGRLTQRPGPAACVSNTGAGRCADGAGLHLAQSVTVSPDGRSAYVASFGSGAVAAFHRGPVRRQAVGRRPGNGAGPGSIGSLVGAEILARP